MCSDPIPTQGIGSFFRLTSLLNFSKLWPQVFPKTYDTKDLAMPAKEPCGCGRSLPVLGSIEGRAKMGCPDHGFLLFFGCEHDRDQILSAGAK
jgi:hypothetical protein